MLKKALKRVRFVLAIALSAIFTLTFTSLGALAEVAATGTTQATVTFTEGNLELKGVPNISFGQHKISDATIFDADTISSDVKVSDMRGNSAGWNLSATLSGFKLTGTDASTLAGSYITISSQAISSPNGSSTSTAPEGTSINMVAGDPSSAVLIMKAEAGNGMGNWNSTWALANTQLTVISGTENAGNSYAVINWILGDTP